MAKQEFVSLDIDKIPKKLYDAVLDEFREQFGKKDYYVDWEINATKKES